MQGAINYNVVVKNSSWVRRVLYNGKDLTVFYDGGSFDLLDVNALDAKRVHVAAMQGEDNPESDLSVGREINVLRMLRNKDGSLKEVK